MGRHWKYKTISSFHILAKGDFFWDKIYKIEDHIPLLLLNATFALTSCFSSI